MYILYIYIYYIHIIVPSTSIPSLKVRSPGCCGSTFLSTVYFLPGEHPYILSLVEEGIKGTGRSSGKEEEPEVEEAKA